MEKVKLIQGNEERAEEIRKTLEDEIWKPIVGYEGLYEVSNFGRVRSLDRIVKINGGNKMAIGRILSCASVRGYLQVSLCKNGKVVSSRVHRLVAKAFIPNPNNLPYINHKDETRNNNRVENLEWCDCAYNVNYGTGIERCSRARINNKARSIAIIGVNVKDGRIIEFPSIREAERNGYSHQIISQICRGIGRYKTHKGHKWYFRKNDEHLLGTTGNPK